MQWWRTSSAAAAHKDYQDRNGQGNAEQPQEGNLANFTGLTILFVNGDFHIDMRSNYMGAFVIPYLLACRVPSPTVGLKPC